jgi:hypothetical protein
MTRARPSERSTRVADAGLESQIERFTDRRRSSQLEGGARAWNEECGDAADIDVMEIGIPLALTFASGNAGSAAGAAPADSWINTQIAQSKPPDPSDLWTGASLLAAAVSDSVLVAAGVALAAAKP